MQRAITFNFVSNHDSDVVTAEYDWCVKHGVSQRTWFSGVSTESAM